MSQYSPYQPPQTPAGVPTGYPYAYPSAPNPAGPARRASVMMFVLGGLAALGGVCGTIGGAALPQMLAQHPELTQDLPPDLTVEAMQRKLLVQAVVFGVYGIVMFLLGLFVRRSSKGVIVSAIVLVGLTLLYLGLNVLGTVLLGSRQGAGVAAVGGCFALVPVALCVLLLVWLVQAMRNAPAARAAGQYPPEYLLYMQQQYAAQQQAYQAWQQQQQQGGQVPPAPPQAPPPPPPPADGGTHGPTGSA